MLSACARIALSLSLNSPGPGSVPAYCFAIVAAVLPEWHLAQEEVAHLVDPVLVGEVEGIDDIADRFRHLLAAVEQEAVGVDALLHGNTRRHQEGRPVHRMEADDVLADDCLLYTSDAADDLLCV